MHGNRPVDSFNVRDFSQRPWALQPQTAAIEFFFCKTKVPISPGNVSLVWSSRGPRGPRAPGRTGCATGAMLLASELDDDDEDEDDELLLVELLELDFVPSSSQPTGSSSTGAPLGPNAGSVSLSMPCSGGSGRVVQCVSNSEMCLLQGNSCKPSESTDPNNCAESIEEWGLGGGLELSDLLMSGRFPDDSELTREPLSE